MAYKAPVRDLTFVLNEVLEIDRYSNQPGFADVSSDLVGQILEEGAKFAEEVIAPLNRIGDQEGCKWDNGKVTGPTGWKEAYKAMVEAGWPALSALPEHGGQGMPAVVAMAFGQMTAAASAAFSMYPGLTAGAYWGLNANGSDEQKAMYLPKMASGEWGGTMNLTEPQCGTDLGLIRTKAVPNGDGSYNITGQKIWISSGEHDFTDNIIHLVLARLPDAPEGVKGISLFVVPKFKVGRDGAMGGRNAVRCGSIEHKMGLHGSATCVMNFDEAEGWLLGPPNKGLAAMFLMMNSARLAVGIQGLGLIERAWQNALAYARDRLQMRAPAGPAYPDKPADPLIVHPDIRRMLLTCRAFAEGGRVLSLYAWLKADVAAHASDAAERAAAETVVGFLTPICKGLLTEAAVECAYHAQQVYGGHGYIAEWGMEQIARDARITTIYEGTTQIQALDLIGRKTLLADGAGLKAVLAEIGAFCRMEADNPALADLLSALTDRADQWARLTRTIAGQAAGDPAAAPAAAFDYLFYSGYVMLAWCWAQRVAAAERSDRGESFKRAQREVAAFYFARILPRADYHAACIEAGPAPLMALADDEVGAGA